MTKTILATLAGSIFSFLGGWVVFGMLLLDFYNANTTSYEGLSKGEMPDLTFIFISGVFSAYIITYVLKRIGKEATFGDGFKHGLVIYVCVAAWHNLAMYSFYNLLTMTITLADIGIQGIFGGVTGGIIAIVLGMGKKK